MFWVSWFSACAMIIVIGYSIRMVRINLVLCDQ